MIYHLLLQLILILLNAFFAATEIAVISLNEKKVKARAEDGDKKANKMLKMSEEPTGFLSTIQCYMLCMGWRIMSLYFSKQRCSSGTSISNKSSG